MKNEEKNEEKSFTIAGKLTEDMGEGGGRITRKRMKRRNKKERRKLNSFMQNLQRQL
jgi:hypothetical protein